MEHRWNTRKAVAARVIVYHPRYGSCIGNVCNASASGAFIELLEGECPLNSPVTLLLPFEDASRTHLLQLPAMVVRAEGQGVALMLLDHDDESARALQHWMELSRASQGTAEIFVFPSAASKHPQSMHGSDTFFTQLTSKETANG